MYAMDEKQSTAAQFVMEQTKNAIHRGYNDARHNSDVESAAWTKGECERVKRDWLRFEGVDITPAMLRTIRAAYYTGRAIADNVAGDGYRD